MSVPGVDDVLLERARAWAAEDPDPATRTELESLINNAASDPAVAAELADAFAGRLQFGTAGLRGKLGPGPNRMNRVLVAQAAAGLAAHLLATGPSADHDQQPGRPKVTIGFDARHNSEVFARDTAEIMAGAGFEALLFDRHLPTPLIPYVIKKLHCVAGVVVTASHNPPADNGYKVYLDDGSQIVPPADAEIAAQIDQVAARPLAEIVRSSAVTMVGDELLDAYVARTAAALSDGPREVRWVHTALHGVGAPVMEQAALAAGFGAPISVATQREPDPDFPTVDFPNPEEPGAIDAALAAAAEHDADVVIANDPDADRCAVAIRRDGEWAMLRGDQVGALLGDAALRRKERGVYAASVVSSSLLSEMAEAHGQPYVTTLTGFKWIGRVEGLVFGYEEALGYCCDPTAVADKDGISAALRVLELAAAEKAAGRSLADRLDDIDREYGIHATDQLSVRVDDLSLITAAMERIRTQPPKELLNSQVAVVDLAEGSDDLPPTDGVWLSGDCFSVVVRPSGTEPKLKCYLEVRRGVDRDLAADRAKANETLATLKAEMQQALGM
ncbi:phospho-sugar mutase [Propionibacteriaceae bacterium Y1685]